MHRPGGLFYRNILMCAASNQIMRGSPIALFMCLLAFGAQPAKKVIAAKKAPPKAAPIPVAEDWLVWGGKNRDFLVNSSGLADSWPANGPEKLSGRALG